MRPSLTISNLMSMPSVQQRADLWWPASRGLEQRARQTSPARRPAQ
jgi:hypothetical protein